MSENTKKKTKASGAIPVALALAIGVGAISSGCELDEVLGSGPAPTWSPVTVGALSRPDTVTGPYSVVRAVDGDTIVIDRDGAEQTVRLIGVDTPETKKPNTPVQCYGPEASQYTSEQVTGRQVWIEEDPSQGTTDKYGRALGYVWLDESTMLNAALLAGGYAHEYTYDTAYIYQGAFIDAELRAQTAGAGLWAADTCAGETTGGAA